MLDEKIETLLNGFGVAGVQKIIDMAQVELFRNYCIHNFNWFKGGIKAHGDQHRCEKTWMRFYIDHGRLPKNINFDSILDGTITQKYIEGVLDDIYNAYKTIYKFDIMDPDKELKLLHLELSSF